MHSRTRDSSFTKFLEQLFRGLWVPEEYRDYVASIIGTPEKFCESCVRSVKKVMWLQSKIDALQLEVQMTVQGLGATMMEATANLDENMIKNTASSWSPWTKDIWQKFRLPVIQNFAEGRLEHPTSSLSSDDIVGSTAKSKASQTEQLEATQESLPEENSEPQVKVENKAKRARRKCSPEVTKSIPAVADQVIIGRLNTLSTQSPPVSTVNKKSRVHVVCPSPSCEFKVYFNLPGSPTPGKYASAVCIMKRHFMKFHCPATKHRIQINEEGQEFFPCASCPFKSFVTDNLLGKRLSTHITARRDSALLVLSNHRMHCHSKENSPSKKLFQPRKKSLPGKAVPD